MQRITGALIILVALSGCEIIAGIEDTTETTPVDARPAIDAPVDAQPIDAMPVDLDDDGILNEDDNCPERANPNQYDEDADGVGDLCDNCPSVANADQANVLEGADPDGVGDLCDPHPGIGGDRILHFEPFRDPLSLVWETLQGGDTWVVADGMLSNSDAAPGFKMLYWEMEQATDVVIESEVIIDSLPDPVDMNDHRSAGVFATIDTGTFTGYGCAIELDPRDAPPTSHVRVIRQNDPSGWSIWGLPAPEPMSEGVRYKQRLEVDTVNDTVQCTMSGPFAEVEPLVIDKGMFDTGFIGLRTLGTAARYEYITVYIVDQP